MKEDKNLKNTFKVKRSRSGLGLFAEDDIKKGDFIIEYTGKIISHDEANEKGGKYLFEINSKRTIDGSGRENKARYINHSCRPNCEVEIKKDRVFVYAKKKIKAGEELSYDYGKEYFDEYIKPYGCRCDKCIKS
ncbi:SET domain-containing protein [Candidatus Azambacteria bacterium]|nr:SET domain-containing protein [Candidatus Azambacteria bacterium]